MWARDATLVSPPARPVGRFRWVICALLFFATTINYVDRACSGCWRPTSRRRSAGPTRSTATSTRRSRSPTRSGSSCWAGSSTGWGRGSATRIALVVWSLAAAGHALARTAFGFGVARFFLGLGEAGNFPAAIKTTAEWFPRRERALATGIFNAGSNIGAVLAPLLVPVLALRLGWRSAFLVTGLLGLVWVAFWLPLYDRPERHPRVSRRSWPGSRSDPPEPLDGDPLAPAPAAPADLGVRGRQVPDRPDLVVLPVLVGEVPRRPVRGRPQARSARR